MKKKWDAWNQNVNSFLVRRFGISMRTKLIVVFLLVMVLPLILVTVIAWTQFDELGAVLTDIAVEDASTALDDSAIENIERMTTDTAIRVADFLYGRDDDIRYLASIEPTEENYRRFMQSRMGSLIVQGEWTLSEDGMSWVPVYENAQEAAIRASSNPENEDMDGFHYRVPEAFETEEVPLYDEITFVDLQGVEQVKIVSNTSRKVNYPLTAEKRDVSKKENTYVKAENYFSALQSMEPGEIYVSDVIGAYTKSNYIGMYVPEVVKKAGEDRGYDIEFDPEAQSYAGQENPNGQRFEGIVRWATPVKDESGAVIGYVTFALNHDHIMEFVDHITPMNERYTQLPSAFEGNYAFIWDYQCRSICHPRHHSIVGYNPETGDPEIPWLESSIYDAWQESGIQDWNDFIVGWPEFDGQSRKKTPAPILTKEGYVGLDGRYLNNAPQCTGWMDLTQDGGSGSFYILWSGLYKLTTAAAIPYYTGQYAPSEQNDYSQRGFGIVTIGAGLEDFTRPAKEMEEKLTSTTGDSLAGATKQFIITTTLIAILVVIIAIWIASSLTGNITKLIKGISRFRSGERQFRFNAPVKDEFGTLADSFDDMAESIVDSVKNPLCITDMDEKVIYMNPYGLELRKMTLEQIVGTDYADNSVYPAGTKYYPILALQEGFEAEIYYNEAADQYIRGVARYFVDKQGERIGYIVETFDVTAMVREQMKIEEQRTLLDMIFSASPDVIWYQDIHGRYMAVNPRFAAISGKSVDELLGRRGEEIMPEDAFKSFISNDRDAIQMEKQMYTEERVRFFDGHEETLDAVRTPIFDTTGALVGLLGFARDVSARVSIESELRNTQLQLEKAVSEANRANEHKGEFLARMSHEIRTPMNAIIGITNIVQKKLKEIGVDLEGLHEVEGHINQIEASSQHLLGLLNDILDISKIEAGKIELTDEVVEIEKLAQTVAGIIKPRCDEKNIRFITRFDDFDPSTFTGDSLRLRQVLINLLGNAVKFTPECGTIEFRMELQRREDDFALIHFAVKDTGIGIADEARQAIFQAFEQGSGSVSRQYGGTGLGLAISQRIVQMFGGEIVVASKLGEGSEFSFSIWMRETQSDLPDKEVLKDMTDKFIGKRMLLVDDVAINRMIVTSMIEHTGMEVDEAEDGVQALELFKSSQINGYDIILMDVQMPNMDGYEASEAIRALNRPDAVTVPIIAQTANAFKEDMDKALSHGMNAHVAKPVEMDTLLEVLIKYIPTT